MLGTGNRVSAPAVCLVLLDMGAHLSCPFRERDLQSLPESRVKFVKKVTVREMQSMRKALEKAQAHSF
jgi:hypothetical protein